MLGKLPHPEMILKNILIGIAVAIPIGIAVYVLTAEAPSAVEILILVAGSVLFIALMGLSSLTSFAYSLGFCLSYMVLVLPLNSQAIALDIPFAIDRSMSIGIGAAILALLYILLPRRPLLKKGTLPGTLFEDDLRDVLLKFRHGRSAAETLAQRVGLIIDKLVTASVEVDAATKSTLIDKAGQSIFLLTQVRKVETYLERIGMSQQMAKQLIPWKSELFENYLSAAHTREHSLTSSVSAMQLPPELARAESASSRAFYLGEFDALIRRALEQSVLQEKM
jgi:hypothetical protein